MANWLSKKAMLANLTISQWSARRLDKRITDEVNSSHGAVSDAGRYNKLLVAKAAIDPIMRVVNQARDLHLHMTQPWIDGGARILPAAMFEKYAQSMSDLRSKFESAVDEFCREYPGHVARRRVELNGLFREADYPSEDRIRSLFSFDVNILPCPDAGDFRVDLAGEHAAQIRVDIEKRMKEALNAAMAEPVHRVIELVGRMSDRLAPGKFVEGQKAGIIRDSLVGNVRELVDMLPAFNLTNDPALAALTSRIERELCVEEPEALRENPAARAAVAASAASILAQAKQFMA